MHENFVLRYRSLDWKNCGFLGVSDASLGGVDAFGDPCEDDSKVVNTYSQAGHVLALADSSLMNGHEGVFNLLESGTKTIPRVCRSSMSAETHGLAITADGLEFFHGVFNELARPGRSLSDIVKPSWGITEVVTKKRLSQLASTLVTDAKVL